MRLVIALALAALTACARAERPATVTPPAPATTVSVPAAPGSDWDISVREGVLLATPPGLRPGPAAPYGAAGVREVRLFTLGGAPSPLAIRIWTGDPRTTIAGLASKSSGSRSVTLGSVPATELSLGTERSLARELDERTVIEIVGPLQGLGDEAYAIAALAAATRDSDAIYSRDEVSRALAAAVGLTNERVPAQRLSTADTLSYDLGPNAFAMVMVFTDRASRLLEDPNEGGGFGATISWIARADYRGSANAAVLVGSNDAAVRYRALRSLETLPQRGSTPACTEDARGVFRSFVGALGVSSIARVQERLGADANVSIADARGVLPSGTVRGRTISDVLGASVGAPIIGWTAMRASEVVADGARLATPTGTRATSRDGETDLSVSARVACERGIVRFTDVTIAIGTAAAHPCPELQREGVMTKGIPVNTATKADVLRLLERDAGAIHTLEDIAGVRQDPNPLRDPRVPRCAVAQLGYGDPVFVRRYPGTTGSWFVPVRFGGITVLTMWVGKDERGQGQLFGNQGGEQPALSESEARRIASAPDDAVRSLELVYAKPRGPGSQDQVAWRAVRSSGTAVYLFPSYPGAGAEGALFREDQVTFP